MKLSFKKNEDSLVGAALSISVVSQQTGSAIENIGLTGGVDEELEATFNVDYPIGGISACLMQRVRLSFNDPLKPALISPVPDEDGNDNEEQAAGKFSYLIMPMRDPAAASASR